MWAAFVFFGEPGKIYFIEGDNSAECHQILKSSFNLEPPNFPTEGCTYTEGTLLTALGLFGLDESIFTKQPKKDILYYKKAKEDNIPQTLRAIDGEYCKICKEFAQMAVANQLDGSLVCWSCRDSNRWMFQ